MLQSKLCIQHKGDRPWRLFFALITYFAEVLLLLVELLSIVLAFRVQPIHLTEKFFVETVLIKHQAQILRISHRLDLVQLLQAHHDGVRGVPSAWPLLVGQLTHGLDL